MLGRWLRTQLKKWQRLDRRLRIGLLGVTISFVGGSALFLVSTPVLGLSDPSLHLDYSWQVYKLHLPDFWEGAIAPIGRPQPEVHFVAQHPPLYYALLAPVTGPLIDRGHWQVAAVLGGILTTAMGLACVYAFAWAGWVYGKRRKEEFALAVPAILASMTPFIIVSAAIFNDAPALLFTSLALVMVAIIIRRGVRAKDVALLAVIATLGMASRAAFISTLLVIFLAIPAAIWFHGKEALAKKLRLAIVYNLAITALIVLGIGWFYYRNFRLSGNVTEVAPSTWPRDILGRQYKSLEQMLTSQYFWMMIPRGIYGWPSPSGAYAYTNIYSCVVFFASGLGAAVALLRDKVYKRIDPKEMVIFALLLLLCGLTVGQQLVHSVGYGAVNIRYVLPIWVPLGLMMAYAALAFRRARGLVVIGLVIGGWLSLYTAIMYLLTTRWQALAPGYEGIAFMQRVATQQNHAPAVVVPLALTAIVGGVILQGYALFTLTKQAKK
jgi:hypothetical protein